MQRRSQRCNRVPPMAADFAGAGYTGKIDITERRKSLILGGFMFKNILMPTDGSEHSENAIFRHIEGDVIDGNVFVVSFYDVFNS